MRTLSLPLLLSIACLLGACSDNPCTGGEGPILRVYGSMDETRLAGTDPLAFGSIQEAIDKADSGTTVCIGRGVFREDLWLEVPGVRLVGSGPGLTHLEPGSFTEDPRDSESSVITVNAEDILVEGLRIEGAARGIDLKPGSSGTILNVELLANNVGLYAEDPLALDLHDLLFQHNVESGLKLTGTPGKVVHGSSLVIEGNGDPSFSLAGGLYSELALVLDDVVLRDNTGRAAADLLSRAALSARHLRIERPFSAGGAPRILAQADISLQSSILMVNGATAIQADCEGGQFSMVNTAIAVENSDSEMPALRTSNCNADLNHVTIAHLGLTSAPRAMALDPDSENRVVNSAFVGFDAADEAPLVDEFQGSFSGSLADAALVRPFATAFNLRPQLDSPLVDGGVVSSVLQDVEGQPRPTGPAPDIGAFERH